VLLDFDRIDAENKLLITPLVVDSINRMRKMDLDPEWIAKQLCLDVSEVEGVLKTSNGKS
jgi:hypothetical protein